MCDPAFSLVAMWCLIGATPRGQLWMSAVTFSYGRDGLRTRRMAVWRTCREPSRDRYVHRARMRNAVRNVRLILPATACHQSHDVERYRKFRATPRQVAYILPFEDPAYLFLPALAPRGGQDAWNDRRRVFPRKRAWRFGTVSGMDTQEKEG